MKKLFAVLVALTMLLCSVGMAEEAKAALTKDVVVLFTSDAHCGVDQNYGYAGVAAIRDYFAKSNHVVLADNGDAVQGEPVGTMTKGAAIVDIMNVVGYDTKTIGNHEFDYGMDNFMELAARSAVPYISCNFTYNGELVFEPYTIKEFDGVKIAFVGVTTPRTFVTSTPSYFQDAEGNYVYGFCEGGEGAELYQAVQAAVDSARAEGAEYVFLQGHLGDEAESSPWTSCEVIMNTTGIDVMLDGHAHSEIDPSTTIATDYGADINLGKVKNAEGKDVMLMACGTKLANIGAVTISKNGAISGRLYGWDFADNATKVWGLTGYAVDAVEAATVELNAKLAEVVAHSDVDLHIYNVAGDSKSGRLIRNTETNLGDLCADAYRNQAGNVDIALVNGGGIRVDIMAGDITMNDILKVHPFGNSLTVVEANGQQILDALEWTSRNVPGENGGFLQVSGLTYEIHSYLPSMVEADDHGSFKAVNGEYRVKNVMVGGEPLDLTKTYIVASHDYMLLSGGDGTNMFTNDVVLQESVKLDNQVLIDYIVNTLGGVVGEEYADTYGQGRIVIVAEAPAN